MAANLSTEKTYRASKLGVPIVYQGWFWESVNLWQRQDERPWLAIEPSGLGDEWGDSRPTPGPSAPDTPADEDGDADVDFNFGVLEDVDLNWDDEAQAELDELLEGSSDVESDTGTRLVATIPHVQLYVTDGSVHAVARRHQGHHRRRG